MGYYVEIFDARHFQLSNWLILIVPAGLFFFGLLSIFTIRKQIKEDGASEPQKTRLVFATGFTAFAIVFFVLPVIVNIWEAISIRRTFEHREYKIVEGRVHNFTPIVRDDSFVVDGIKFIFSASKITVGFRRSSVVGGPIRDGDYLRIYYICRDTPVSGDCYDPLIIRIEKAKTLSS